MARKAALLVSAILVFVASQVYALGLGTASLQSALNQPLQLRIEIVQLGNVNPGDIRVTMAAPEDFLRFNIDRIAFLSDIRISIESGASGVFAVLTSTQLVREPYLSFVLDTRWPNGRLLSEHTLLLDLPVFDNSSQSASVRQPISPVLQAPTTPAPVSQAPVPVPAVLTEPAPAPIPEPEAAPVSQQVAVQEAADINRPSPPPQSVPVQPLAAPAPGPDSQNAAISGQLSVITTDDVDAAATRSALQEENAELDARIDALENQLALREEEVDRVRIEREELISRLDDLDAQIASAMEIITLQDLQLAQLQESLAEAARIAAEQQVAAANVTPAPQAPGLLNNLLRLLTSTTLLLILAVVLVVSGLVFVLLRRNKKVVGRFDEAELEELEDDDTEPFVSAPDDAANIRATERIGSGSASGLSKGASKKPELDDELSKILNLSNDLDDFDSKEFEDTQIGKVVGDNQDDVDVNLDALDAMQPSASAGLAQEEDIENVDFDLSDLTEEVVEPKDDRQRSSRSDKYSFDDEESLSITFDLGSAKVAKSEPVAEEIEIDDVEFETDALEIDTDSDADDLDFLSDSETETQLATNTKDEDDDFNFLSADDEAATKLELAYAFKKMNDPDGAREILEEVILEGNPAQIKEALELLKTLNK